MMASTSGDISTLVFKRNISLARADYVLDFHMLRVLGEIEGTRDVATIAASLGADISDVKAICARLLQQQLILPAQSRSDAYFQSTRNTPPESLEAGFLDSTLGSAADDATGIEVDEPTAAESILETLLSAQEDGLGRLERSPTHAGSNAETRGGQPENAAWSWQDSEKPQEKSAWSWPDRLSAEFDSTDEDNTGLGFGSARFRDGGAREPASSAASAEKSSPTDIFSIARTVNRDPINGRSNAFASIPLSKQAKPAVRPVPDAWQADEAGPEEAPRPNVNNKAIEHFEEGLSLLQRSDFKGALRQFEIAMALDPQNRLCRANIQRIQNILTRDQG